MENFDQNNNWNVNSDPVAQDTLRRAGTDLPDPGSTLGGRPEMGHTTYEDGWRYPGNNPAAPKPPCEKKRKKGTGRVIALALVCALLGGVGGGAGMNALLADRYEAQAQALQQQIDDLKENSKGDTTILTAVSADGLKSGAQIYQENVESVVSVTAKGKSPTTGQAFESRGTGFLIASEGFILTNQHVVGNAKTITVTTNSGKEYDAKLMGADEYFDVALLKIEGENLPAVTIGDSDNVAVGEEVVAIGNALGKLSSSFTGGYLSGVDRMVSTDGTAINMMQTDAAINSGNSGGPLFNMKGEVIGITSAKYSGSTSSGASIEGIGFAIPINDVMKLVSDLRDYGYVKGQAYLGITASNVNVDKATAEMYNLPLGVLVHTVDEGGAAQKAGVQVGDIITAVGGEEVTSMDSLSGALRQHSAGETSTITVYRSGSTLALDITFDEKVVEQETVPETQPQQEQTPQMPAEDDSWNDWYEFFNRYFNGD